MTVRARSALASIVALSLAVAACSSVEPRLPYTSAEAETADIPGMGGVRFFADGPAFVFDRFRREVFAQAARRHAPVSYLALSSGGAEGAFGAGFLKGLSEANRRPQFTIVSGVSTGALMAPFAFLGPTYDGLLEDLYTNGLAATLVKSANLLNGVFGNALVDSDKLGHLIAHYITQDTLDAVAAEHRKGRRLLIVTTDLDAQRSVIWDMGAIAGSGSPNALSLFRQVLAASASIPGVFPPRRIAVESGGRAFQELHVDGATVRQIYVAPDALIFGDTGRDGTQTGRLGDIFIVINSKMAPSFQLVEDTAVAVAARALSTVVKREGRNDVLSAYAYASRHGIGYHLAYIDDNAPEPPSDDAAEAFSTSYMRTLFERGEAQARSGAPWAGRPPLEQDPPPRDLAAAR